MLVMKFGGASLSDALAIANTCRIVRQYRKKHKLLLIVSAMQGVTDQLFEISRLLSEHKLAQALEILAAMRARHFATLLSISKKPTAVKSKIELHRLFYQLEYFVKNVAEKELTLARIDYLVSWGERLSCRIVTEALEEADMLAYALDASTFLATSDDFGNAVPIYTKSQSYIQEILSPLIDAAVIPVVTGYIGFTHDGCTTTLGRGGSDLSAAFIANFLDAEGLYLWKDVPGVFDQDPHTHPEAKLLPSLDYATAERMAKAGAKIIYYKAIEPVQKKSIPIYVKSFVDPTLAGTVISQKE